MDTPSLSVVIPTHDTCELTLACLSSLDRGGARPADVIVVDDASSDGTAEAIRTAYPEVTVLETDANIGFSRAVNLGVERTTGGVILVLNSDTEVLGGALAALVEAFAGDQALGIGGAELVASDGRPQWRAGRWPSRWWLFLQASGLGSTLGRFRPRLYPGASGSARIGAVDWVSGAAMAISRRVWESCGPFDVDYRFYCQDLDLCCAARGANWTVAVVEGFKVMHHLGASIAATAGASGTFHPAHLWSDFVRFVEKYEGAEAGKNAASAIRAGARLRLAGRAVAGPFSGDREAWARESNAYCEGLEALDT